MLCPPTHYTDATRYTVRAVFPPKGGRAPYTTLMPPHTLNVSNEDICVHDCCVLESGHLTNQDTFCPEDVLITSSLLELLQPPTFLSLSLLFSLSLTPFSAPGKAGRCAHLQNLCYWILFRVRYPSNLVHSNVQPFLFCSVVVDNHSSCVAFISLLQQTCYLIHV